MAGLVLWLAVAGVVKSNGGLGYFRIINIKSAITANNARYFLDRLIRQLCRDLLGGADWAEFNAVSVPMLFACTILGNEILSAGVLYCHLWPVVRLP